jgi:hypothetical protein
MQVAREALESCASVFDGLKAVQYTRPSEHISGSSIGQHVRHAIDHFVAITDACASSPIAAIDYDHRERQTAVETDPAFALAAINRVRLSLEMYSDETLASPVHVRLMANARGELNEIELSSTVARELMFASHHAVHHFAMIGTIVREFGFSGASLPEGFGRAPSTLRFDARQASGGKSQ